MYIKVMSCVCWSQQEALQDVDAGLLLRMLADLGSAASSPPAAGAGFAVTSAYARLQVTADRRQFFELCECHSSGAVSIEVLLVGNGKRCIACFALTGDTWH